MIGKALKQAGLTLCALLIFTSTFAQLDDFNFLRTAPLDAEKYLQAYMEPWTNAFGAGLNGGWYNTAKPHKLLGFDLTTSFNVGVVPTSAGEMDLSKLGFTSLQGSGKAPTVSGADEGTTPTLTFPVGSQSISFPSAPGTNWRYIPVPTLQLGLGLPMGTEVKGRLIPEINIGDGNISLWGIGLMHNITQYFPGDKLLPFDVSVFGGFTKLKGGVPITVDPGYPQNYSPAVSFEDQKLDLELTGLNISAIASLNLPVITFYGGLGYSKTKTTMNLTGNFPTPVWNASQNQIEYNNSGVKTSAQFPEMSIENYSGLRANIGFRIKLAIITIHADYTRAQYNVLSAGLGISVR